MENCQVTKLTGIVNNNTMPRFGGAAINIAAGQTIKINGSWFNSESKIFLKEGNVACTYDGSSVSLPFILPTSNKEIQITASIDSIIEFTSVYEMIKLDLTSGNNWGFDLHQLEYAPIKSCNVSEMTNVYGDIKYAYKFGNIQTSIVIGTSAVNDRIYGDIAVFGNCLSATSINVRYQTGISGTLESLVKKYYKNERTTGSILMRLRANLFKFNGSYVTTTDSGKTLSWQPNSDTTKIDVTWDGTTITIDA